MFLKLPYGDDEWVFVNVHQVTHLVWHQEVHQVTDEQKSDGRTATGVSVTFFFTDGQRSLRVSNLSPEQATEIGKALKN
jgi:hypothetical protein